MNRKIREELRSAIEAHLHSHLAACVEAKFYGRDVEMELYIKEKPDDRSQRIVRICILDDCHEIQIPNILFPNSWRGRGDGLRLISIIYRVAKRHGYTLFVTDLVSSFLNYLTTRCGAKRIGEDTVEIGDDVTFVRLDTSVLRPHGHCYGAALEAARELDKRMESGEVADEIRIVHGHIVPISGIDAGRRIEHAWIESGEEILDPSDDEYYGSSREAYYSDFQAQCDLVYSLPEAEKLATQFGENCRWRERSSD